MATVVEPPASTMAQIALNGMEAEQALAAEGEMPEQIGFLGQFVFMPFVQTLIIMKVTELFLEILQPMQQPKEEKSFDPKNNVSHLSYKEPESIQAKELQVQKSEKPYIDSKKEEESENRIALHAKADHSGRRTLQMPRQHPPPTRPVSREALQERTELAGKTPRAEQQKEKQESRNLNEGKLKSFEKGETREQQRPQAHEQQIRQHVESQTTTREQEKTDDRQEQRKRKDDHEEGSAEDGKDQKRDDDPEENENIKVDSVRKKGIDPQELHALAVEESTLLSELLKMQVTHFDVLVLFIEVMKLSLKGREQERFARMRERELQLEHIQNLVANFEQQGQWQLFSNLGAGVLSFASAFLPVVGHLQGPWILENLSAIPFCSRFKDWKPEEFFKYASKMAGSMAEMQKSSGQIQQSFAESSRTYDQHMAEMRKADGEEDTRSMDELRDQFKNMENFLHQFLQMVHDTIRQLYN